MTGGEAVSVAYTRPATGSATLRDTTGNVAASFSAMEVGNGPDTTAPVIGMASASGDQLVLSYTEANKLDAVHTANSAAFAVHVNGVANAVRAVAVDAAAKTVTLTLSTPVTGGETVRVAYTAPPADTGAAAIQDATGNDAAGFTDMAVHSGPDTTAPVISSAKASGNQLVLSCAEANALDAEHKPAPEAFTVLVDGVRSAVTAVAVDALANTVALTL
ncbi:hypothetical protein D8B23_21630, partial [Verminephrobacter aporrectodeae subsp. tuberculatae]|nr:hypothetical protein [Verminephrobacter aporrectodeae subsp. tuberculatae]